MSAFCALLLVAPDTERHVYLCLVKAPSYMLSLLFRGNPNMNSLIGLGAATSFTAGTASILLPGAGLEIGFLEEPVMLLAFVLLGRALETRARLKASGMSHMMSSTTIVSSGPVIATAPIKMIGVLGW